MSAQNLKLNPSDFGFELIQSSPTPVLERRILHSTQGDVDIDPHFDLRQSPSTKFPDAVTLSVIPDRKESARLRIAFNTLNHALIASGNETFCMAALWEMLIVTDSEIACNFLDDYFQLDPSLKPILHEHDIPTAAFAQATVISFGGTTLPVESL